MARMKENECERVVNCRCKKRHLRANRSTWLRAKKTRSLMTFFDIRKKFHHFRAKPSNDIHSIPLLPFSRFAKDLFLIKKAKFSSKIFMTFSHNLYTLSSSLLCYIYIFLHGEIIFWVIKLRDLSALRTSLMMITNERKIKQKTRFNYANVNKRDFFVLSFIHIARVQHRTTQNAARSQFSSREIRQNFRRVFSRRSRGDFCSPMHMKCNCFHWRQFSLCSTFFNGFIGYETLKWTTYRKWVREREESFASKRENWQWAVSASQPTPTYKNFSRRISYSSIQKSSCIALFFDHCTLLSCCTRLSAHLSTIRDVDKEIKLTTKKKLLLSLLLFCEIRNEIFN